VGAGEDRLRHRETERLRGSQVDRQLEFCRLLHRQVGRLGALEDLPGVDPGLAIGSCVAGSICDQAASPREFAPPNVRIWSASKPRIVTNWIQPPITIGSAKITIVIASSYRSL